MSQNACRRSSTRGSGSPDVLFRVEGESGASEQCQLTTAQLRRERFEHVGRNATLGRDLLDSKRRHIGDARPP